MSKPELFPKDIPGIKRNVAACGLAPLMAMFFIALFGVTGLFCHRVIYALFGNSQEITAFNEAAENGFYNGIMSACVGMIFNWILFLIVYPIVLLIWVFTVGKQVHRGIQKTRYYLICGGIVGAVLNGISCSLLVHLVPAFGDMNDFDIPPPEQNPWMVSLGGGLAGLIVGAVAGIFTAAIYVAILRPASQLQRRAPGLAEVFS